MNDKQKESKLLKDLEDSLNKTILYATVNTILDLYTAKKVVMTNLKLQKIFYYVYGFYYALFDEPLDQKIDNNHKIKFEAWRLGAVEPTIHQFFKGFFYKKIDEEYRFLIPNPEKEKNVNEDCFEEDLILRPANITDIPSEDRAKLLAALGLTFILYGRKDPYDLVDINLKEGSAMSMALANNSLFLDDKAIKEECVNIIDIELKHKKEKKYLKLADGIIDTKKPFVDFFKEDFIKLV